VLVLVLLLLVVELLMVALPGWFVLAVWLVPIKLTLLELMEFWLVGTVGPPFLFAFALPAIEEVLGIPIFAVPADGTTLFVAVLVLAGVDDTPAPGVDKFEFLDSFVFPVAGAAFKVLLELSLFRGFSIAGTGSVDGARLVAYIAEFVSGVLVLVVPFAVLVLAPPLPADPFCFDFLVLGCCCCCCCC